MKISELTKQYQSGEQTPKQTIEQVYNRIDTVETNVWISVREKEDVIADANQLVSPSEQPLYGLPFAIKDNIDVDGLPTTAACPAYAYNPHKTATVVEELINAGALLIGKTNMDQFASGLVGTRSPYGVCRNVHNPKYISGGSSSGSAVAVARDEVAFSLGTDTAGSGRVPAAVNGIVGLKPTRGMVSTNGVVPACSSLDCVSIFTKTCQGALLVESVIAGYDPEDGYSRDIAKNVNFDRAFRSNPEQIVGVPDDHYLEFFDDDEAKALYKDAIGILENEFQKTKTIDIKPFVDAAELLYSGPWLAERLEAIEEFIEKRGDEMYPVVKKIISGGEQYSAVDTFRALHELADLKQSCKSIFETVDIIVTPTIGTTYTIEEVQEQPIERNSKLGYYTNYVNLLDLAAIAVPTGTFRKGPKFGVTILGQPGSDPEVAVAGEVIRNEADKIDR